MKHLKLALFSLVLAVGVATLSLAFSASPVSAFGGCGDDAEAYCNCEDKGENCYQTPGSTCIWAGPYNCSRSCDCIIPT